MPRVCSAHSDVYHEQLGGKHRVGAPQQSEHASIFGEPHRALFGSFQNQFNVQCLAVWWRWVSILTFVKLMAER